MIGRDAAEREVVGLTAAHDRIATGMYAIDTHPALGLLRGSTITGLTRERAATLLPEVDRLWAQFTLFGEVLDQIRSLIAPRRPTDAALIEAEQLLRERLLHLDAAGMPTGGGAPTASALSVGELTRQLEQRVAALAGQLAEVDAAWSAVGARIVPLIERVDAAATLATDLGETALADQLRAEVTEANRQDLGDPLAAAPGGRLAGAAATRLAALAAAVDTAQARLRELTLLRDGYPQRVAALGTLLDQLAAAEAAVAQSQQRVREKIVDPGLGEVPDATAGTARPARRHRPAAPRAALGPTRRRPVHSGVRGPAGAGVRGHPAGQRRRADRPPGRAARPAQRVPGQGRAAGPGRARGAGRVARAGPAASLHRPL